MNPAIHARIETTRHTRALCAGLFLCFFAALSPVQASERDTARWFATWTASPQPLWNGDFVLPTNAPFNVWKQTLRQTARVSIGGHRLRVRLSNEYGSLPLTIDAAHVARAAQGSTTVAGSDRMLTFGGKSSVTIPAGAPALSDPVDLDVPAAGSVAVSLYLAAPTPPATFHWDARQTMYIGAGDQTSAQTLQAESTFALRAFVGAILVEGGPDTRSVVALGDSITDGNGSTVDRNARWPDFLAERLAADDVAVLNAGISGNRLLRDGMGVSALARFQRDALDQPGVVAVIVLLGINDISWNHMAFAPHDPVVSADELIAGYRQLLAQGHARGVRMIAGTLTPFESALHDSPLQDYYSADKERVRQAVNAWLRASGEFDAVVDFDALLRDPGHPARFLPAYDSGDHLHPGDAGYKAMADAIDARRLFGAR